jgi:hypothetical protein
VSAVVAMLAVEVLRCEPQSDRSSTMLSALERTAKSVGFDVTSTTRYHGDCPWLFLWGPGAPERAAILQRHVAQGGRVLALDLPYWQRNHKVRVSIDAAHPQAWVLKKDWPAARFASDQVTVADRWKPTGHIVVAGLGRKARVQYGADTVRAWEDDLIRQCRSRWPDRHLVYRRKQVDAPYPQGVGLTSDAPIDQILTGASLVVTWHSNVAVDAIRLGIPVVCRDGAAAAVYPDRLGLDPQPIATDLRDRFLRNLAWFQYTSKEAALCWSFLRELLS